MKRVRNLHPLWLVAVLVSLIGSAPASAQQLITNGGFEAAFAGWTRADQTGSDGTFALQTGTSSPVNGFSVPAPPEGVQAAMTDAGAGGSHVLYQDFLVPVGTAAGTVSFSLFLNSGDTFRSPATLNWATPTLNQQARVDILLPGADPFSVVAGDVLQNLFQTQPGDPTVSGYNNFAVDISSLLQARQGQTLRLRFAEVDNVSFLNLGVDRVSVQAASATAVPEPSAVVLLVAGGGLIGLARRRKSAA